MTYISPLRAGLFSAFLTLTTALANPALAETVQPIMPNLSPDQIAADVSTEFNNRTGEREYIAPGFDPFEEDPDMAGSASLRSVGSAVAIDGTQVRGGAMLDLGFYYNSPTSDPYDIRGFEEAAFLSGELAPVVRRDNRVLECSSNVRETVYDHRYYYAPSLALSFYRPYRRYSGHHGYGGWRRPIFRRGYGSTGGRGTWRRRRGTRTGDGVGRTGRSGTRRGTRTGDGDGTHRRRRDGDDDGTRRRRRDRDGTGRTGTGRTATGRGGRTAEGTAPSRRVGTGRTGTGRTGTGRTGTGRGGRTGEDYVDVDRRREGKRSKPPVSRRRVTASDGTSRPARKRRDPGSVAPRRTGSTASTGTGRRSAPAVSRPAPARSAPAVSQPSKPKASRPAPKRESAPVSRRSEKSSRSSKPSRSSRSTSKPSRAPSSRDRGRRDRLNFFPRDYAYGGREVVTSVDVACAREEMLSVHISAERLDAARFDGMTVLVLDRQGREYPVFVPPNYIEGFRKAVGGAVRGSSTTTTPYRGTPAYQEPVYRAPIQPAPQMASCPAGTVLQPDNTCLQTSAGRYPG